MRWRKTFTPGGSFRDVRITQHASRTQRSTLNPQPSVPSPEQVAFERGLAEGERRLSEQLLRQRQELLELQNGIFARLREAAPQVARQSESGLIQLAIQVAQQLVNGLPVSTEMVEAAVRSALAQVKQTTEIHVCLHADDLALLQACNSGLLPGPGNESVRFQASPEVTRGGCVVRTRFGVIDGLRETKLELIRQSLKD